MATEGMEHKPRSYQMELLEHVIHKNGIIYLPTGAGKTYIAILALKRFSSHWIETIENGGKRAIYMCNTVDLATQQYIELKKNTNFEIGLYTGSRNTDNWDCTKWKEEIVEHQVLVGTAQVFLDAVMKNYIKLKDLSIVIIDECHHASKLHPMHEFMKLLCIFEEEQRPRVIGLTGCLIKGNKLSNVIQDLSNLELTLLGDIITVKNIEQYNNVMLYSTKPHEEIVLYNISKEDREEKIETIIKNEVENLIQIIDIWDAGSVQKKCYQNLNSDSEFNKKKFIKNLLNDFLFQMNEYGLYGASFAITFIIIELEMKKRSSETLKLQRMFRIAITKCELIRHQIMGEFINYVGNSNMLDADVHTIEIITKFSTPKLNSLLNFISSRFKNLEYNDINCLLFVTRRLSAKCLYYILDNYIEAGNDLKNILKAQFTIGGGSTYKHNESENILDSDWNKKVIKKFRDKECNVVVCSNVLEEGIDIQACNYVLVFDKLQTFNSYIQTKGRARSSGSTYIVFCEENEKTKVLNKLYTYCKIQENIQKYLMNRVINNDIEDENILKYFHDIIPPFRTSSGACLLASGATSLLNQYCQTLPSDLFTTLSPWYELSNIDQSSCRVSIKLPHPSTVKDIIVGDSMPSKKLAKTSAAHKACIRLFENGELNDNFFPITKKDCIANLSTEFFSHWEKFDDNVHSKTLGKQCRRLYDRISPEELYGAMPILGEICYAYEILFTPDFRETSEYNEFLIPLFNGKSNYAILLSRRFPLLALMPLFMNQGKLNCKISNVPYTFTISNEHDLELLRNFHVMLFRDIILKKIWWKSFFAMDRRNKENSFLIVPLTENHVIDWDLVKKFQRLNFPRRISVEERKKHIYREEDFVGSVVSKWYFENDDIRHYIVTKVLGNMTPMSNFDSSSNFKNIADFYESKYKDKIDRIVHVDKFLLEVKPLTSRRNFYLTQVQKNADRKLRTEILIPELCHNFMFPSDMWLKAIFLPSVLQRLQVMLHAEHIRVHIADYLSIKSEFLMNEPKPLMIDMSLRRNVDFDGNAIEIEEKPVKRVFTIAPKSIDTRVQNDLILKEQTHWSEYMKPLDISRRILDVYPIEIDYYHHFVNNKLKDVRNNTLIKNLEDELNKSQLVMSPIESNLHTKNMKILSITDVPLEDQRRIEILERSFDHNSHLTAEQCEFVSALTTSGASDTFDMERFELLGDSFLKFSISLFLIKKFPQWHEGFLTAVKSKIVSNRNLLYCMLQLDIPKRIYSKRFQAEEWLPPLLSLPVNLLEYVHKRLSSGKGIKNSSLYSINLSDEEFETSICSEYKLEEFMKCYMQDADVKDINSSLDNDINVYVYKDVMSDKTVSDTLESILGVCVKNYGIHRSFLLLEFFGIIKSEPRTQLSSLLDINFGSNKLRTNISSADVDGFLINYGKLENNLGYKFKDRAYLLQALTHPSYPTNRITGCYQELEFIGDAILDFLVSCYIFEKHQNMTPGMLTDLRSALVNNITLACICVRHRFHLFLLYENEALCDSIKRFADFQKSQNYRVTTMVKILSEESDIIGDECSDLPKLNLSQRIDVPKVLGDIVEALIAAVYFDSRDLKTTWHVVYHLLQQELNDFGNNIPIDPVRELCEKQVDAVFSKAIENDGVIMVKCRFTCLTEKVQVCGFAINSQQAKKAAAKQALQILAKHGS